MQSVHQILDAFAVCYGVYGRQEDGSGTAEDQKAHAGLLSKRPPFVRLFKVNKGVDGEAELSDREGENDGE